MMQWKHLLMTGMLLATGVWAQPALTPEAFRSATLDYHAAKFFLSADTRVTQRWLTPEAAARDWALAGEEGAKGLAAGERTAFISMASDVIGRRSLAQVWLREDGTALQRTSVRLDHKHRARLYRFFDGRVLSLKRYPEQGEADQPWPAWSRMETEWFDLPAGLAQPVTRGEGLFYLAVAAPLHKPGDQWQATLFDSDGPLVLTLKVEAETSLPVDLTLDGPEGRARLKASIPTLRIRATATPIGDRGGEFSFLGLKGGITLYLDPQRHLIVRLEGKADVLGEVTIHLQQVRWAGNGLQ